MSLATLSLAGMHPCELRVSASCSDCAVCSPTRVNNADVVKRCRHCKHRSLINDPSCTSALALPRSRVLFDLAPLLYLLMDMMYTYIHIYIYIYRERESVYIYIYM